MQELTRLLTIVVAEAAIKQEKNEKLIESFALTTCVLQELARLLRHTWNRV